MASNRVTSKPATEKSGFGFCFTGFSFIKGFRPNALPIRLILAHNATSPMHKIMSLPIIFLMPTQSQIFYSAVSSKNVRAAATRAALFSAIVPSGINSEFSNPTRTFPPSDIAF